MCSLPLPMMFLVCTSPLLRLVTFSGVYFASAGDVFGVFFASCDFDSWCHLTLTRGFSGLYVGISNILMESFCFFCTSLSCFCPSCHPSSFTVHMVSFDPTFISRTSPLTCPRSTKFDTQQFSSVIEPTYACYSGMQVRYIFRDASWIYFGSFDRPKN